MATDLPAVLYVEDLARLLGIGPHGVRAMLRRGDGPRFMKKGGTIRVRREAWLAWWESAEDENDPRRKPTSPHPLEAAVPRTR